MDIDLWIADPNRVDAHDSLHNQLNNDEYIKQNAKLNLAKRKGMAGVELAVIQLVISTGFELAKLALSIAEWRRKNRDTAADIVVKANERETAVSLAAMGDSDEEQRMLLRALAGAPDPRRSVCVLVGIDDYANLPTLPGVKQNLEQLAEVLADSSIWGIPEDGLIRLPYPGSGGEVTKAVTQAAARATDTLVFYFAGHGLHDSDDGLLLALPEATGRDKDETVPWRELATLIKRSDAKRRIVLLDCCYAGLALTEDGGPEDRERPPGLLQAAGAEGTYLMVAAQKSGQANASEGNGCTAFTGELVEVLKSGIAPESPREEFISLNWLHTTIKDRLEEQRLPESYRKDPGGRIGQLPHFQNKLSWRPEPEQGPEPVPPNPPNPPNPPGPPPRQNVAAIAIIAALVLAVVVAIAGVAYGSGKNDGGTIGLKVSGLSLTKYCSSLGSASGSGFNVSGGDCIQAIDLSKACDFSYQTSGLQATLTTADPNSAVCVNPATRVTYTDGIPNMSGYCGTLASVAGVTATATNPGLPNTWVCQLPINMNLACSSQNNQSDLVARRVDGAWSCFREE